MRSNLTTTRPVGNTTETEEDHVLWVCVALVVSMGLSSFAGVLLWLRREPTGSTSPLLPIVDLFRNSPRSGDVLVAGDLDFVEEIDLVGVAPPNGA